ncbi:MAG TPA: hypothetical protein VGN37_21445 [Actinocatenispora sp.]
MPSDWSSYAAAAGRLAAVRRAERERTGGLRKDAESARAELTEVADQLVEQQSDLVELARKLRLPAPSFPPADRTEIVGLAEEVPAADRLATARQRLHDANVAADAAEDLGEAPVLLPGWRPRARVAVVYAGCSLAALVGQLVMIGLYSHKAVTDQVGTYAWTCCGFPALAFFAGYLLVGLLCRPRSSTTPVDRFPRMGAALCAASLPVYALVLGMLGTLF